MSLQTIAPNEGGPMPVLELTDVTFRRDGNEIIRGVSFTVHAGEHWAMLGPNGAGKSTGGTCCRRASAAGC
jgi:ABC-type molybdenum transport system ATPase subunit/photorepair protein PhrA